LAVTLSLPLIFSNASELAAEAVSLTSSFAGGLLSNPF
jgi:hypothetical protein